MSETVLTTQYPELKTEHLEIIPIFSNKILYQDVPTHIPNLTLEEKSKFLDAVLKTFEEDVDLVETGFRIKYLDDPSYSLAFRAIHKDFGWVQQNQYSLLAICNFVPQLFSAAQTPNTRATAQETREAFKNVIDKEEYKALCDIMAAANPDDS